MDQESVNRAVTAMSQEQFTAYESAIRSRAYEDFNDPNLVMALRAVNQRRANERSPLDVTVREGSGFMTLPLWAWVTLGAIAALALMDLGRGR